MRERERGGGGKKGWKNGIDKTRELQEEVQWRTEWERKGRGRNKGQTGDVTFRTIRWRSKVLNETKR